MENYVEQRLNHLHDTGTKTKFKQKILTFIVAALVVFFLPYLHIGVFYRLWVDKPPVPAKCSCNCFDTVFRGRYEWPPSAYKHFYFNATRNTLWIWLILILGIFGVYEIVRYVFTLWWERRLRWPMLLILVSALYPHYYGWWGLINYLNEEFYPQWYHQVAFSLTEAASTGMVVHLCNSEVRLEPSKLLFIIVINLMHIMIAMLDQFVANIIYRQGKGFEAVRDLALMMPDIFHVILPFFELQAIARRKRVPVFRLFYREELMLSTLGLILFTILFKNV